MGFCLKLFFQLIMCNCERADKNQLRNQRRGDNKCHLLAEAVFVRIEFHSAVGLNYVKSDESLRMCRLAACLCGKITRAGRQIVKNVENLTG